MRRDLSTPVWAIERFRDAWLTFGVAHEKAAEFYRRHIYEERPDYPWRSQVVGYHDEVVHQVREAFDPAFARGDVAFSNVDDRFVVHLDELTSVRCSAVHRGGLPNLNNTRASQRFLGQQHLMFVGEVEDGVSAVEADQTMLLVGCEILPGWEQSPIVTVRYIADGKGMWSFETSDAEMDRVLAKYREAN